MMVKRVTTYVLKCEACFKTTDDMEAQFCPSCGNHTLYKVATTVAADGSVHHNSLKRRQNLRGTKFSIPLPKGGRRGVNEDLLLREDQLPKRRKARDKDLMDEDTSGWTFSYKSKGQGAKKHSSWRYALRHFVTGKLACFERMFEILEAVYRGVAKVFVAQQGNQVLRRSADLWVLDMRHDGSHDTVH